MGDTAGPRGFRGLAAVATRDVTPPVGIRNRNWGPATVDVAAGVHRPFALTALAVQAAGGGDPVVMIGVDATWWRAVSDYLQMRDALHEGLGLDDSRVLFCLSHTHAGAALGGGEADLPGGQLIPGYLQTLREAAVSAGQEAIARLRPAIIEWTTGRCDLAANREAQVAGRALVAFNPTQPADDTVTVGRISAQDGRLLGTVVNYACHPTTLAWQNQLLSPDYVGAMRECVETITGAPCLFLQGASGDLAPREQYVGDPAIADRHGTALGHAVLSALATMPLPGTALRLEEVIESGAPLGEWSPVPALLPENLAAARTEVEMPLRPLPSLDELAAQWADIDPRSRDERIRRARNLREGYIDGPSVAHPLWTIRIGDAVIVAQPGEAYSSFQTTLRARFPELSVIAVNLANGPGFVYLPDQDAYRRNAYQAWQTVLAPGALDLLCQAAVEQIREITDRTSS
jgi:hypothetical protein